MTVLKVHLTYECSAACDHCRFGCTPRPGPLLDATTLLDTARTLRDANGLDLVVLLGGEPGLYPGYTLDLVGALRAMGLGVRVETNASWATDQQRARRFLAPLVGVGASVMFSLDAFHEPHIPPERVGLALRVTHELGGVCNVESAFLLGPGSAHPQDRRTEALIAEHAGDTRVYRGPVLFVGRAAARLAPLVCTGRGVPSDPCVAVPWWAHGEQDSLYLLTLDPDGYLSKGCGIAIGNVRERPVRDIIAGYRAAHHPIIGRLIERGPLALAEEAVARGLYTLRPDYADRCHLCQEARTALRPVYPEWLVPDQHYGPWEEAPAPGDAAR